MAIRHPQVVVRLGIVRLEVSCLLDSRYRFVPAPELAIADPNLEPRLRIAGGSLDSLLEIREGFCVVFTPTVHPVSWRSGVGKSSHVSPLASSRGAQSVPKARPHIFSALSRLQLSPSQTAPPELTCPLPQLTHRLREGRT